MSIETQRGERAMSSENGMLASLVSAGTQVLLYREISAMSGGINLLSNAKL